MKYNRDGGRVDVELHADGGQVSIVVTDTGIGMSTEEAARLFSDFVRIKNEKTRNILGSGLGLSTVKKIALLYGGEVSVESEPDKGSRFTVTLNRDAAAAGSSPRTGSAVSRGLRAVAQPYGLQVLHTSRSARGILNFSAI